jgi:hypothetical protein
MGTGPCITRVRVDARPMLHFCTLLMTPSKRQLVENTCMLSRLVWSSCDQDCIQSLHCLCPYWDAGEPHCEFHPESHIPPHPPPALAPGPPISPVQGATPSVLTVWTLALPSA